jgi:hypothetical protein
MLNCFSCCCSCVNLQVPISATKDEPAGREVRAEARAETLRQALEVRLGRFMMRCTIGWCLVRVNKATYVSWHWIGSKNSCVPTCSSSSLCSADAV